jgi:adenosylcobinamide-GDP ribazoletransferase
MKNWLDDFRTAIAFLTRVPMPHPDGPRPANFGRMQRAFPLVGAAIGGVVGLILLGLLAIGLPAIAAGALALGASALLTGGLHEDGLADLADGFGGGRDKAAKLEIMRDSRLGTYGALILLVSFAAKVSALATLPLDAIVPSLVSAHSLARGALPLFSSWQPFARNDGLAVRSIRPDLTTTIIAAALSVAIALFCLPLKEALASALVAILGAGGIVFIARRQIGGLTGDVLGAAEQVGETCVLLVLAVRFA